MYPPIHPTIHPPIHSFVYLPIHPSASIHPPIFQSIHPSRHPSIHLSIHSSNHPYIHPSIHPSIRPSLHSSTHPSINPSISPLFHLFLHSFGFIHTYYETQHPYCGLQGTTVLPLNLFPSTLPSHPTPITLTLLLQALCICSLLCQKISFPDTPMAYSLPSLGLCSNFTTSKRPSLITLDIS